MRSTRFSRWREKRQREAVNRAAIGRGCGLVSMDMPPPVPVRGMYLDPRQVPVTLMQPAMDAGQQPRLRACDHDG